MALGFAVGGVALAGYVVLGRSPAPDPVMTVTAPPAASTSRSRASTAGVITSPG